MKNIRFFLSESFQFLEVKFYIYLNRCVFVMPFDVSKTARQVANYMFVDPGQTPCYATSSLSLHEILRPVFLNILSKYDVLFERPYRKLQLTFNHAYSKSFDS